MMNSFLTFQHNRRNSISTHKRVHHNTCRGTRSISLLDRRGLISASKFLSRKSSISPLLHRKRQHMDSTDSLAMLMHLLEIDDNHPFRDMFLPTITNTDRSTHKSMIWQHIQRGVPLHVQPFSKVIIYY
ncbi:unnamed protein product [Cercopithifilaria johnstoni]|uniref:Uncharacterized protein n=1 Tax=Cercopithifilaria johnstoni TaxID=2874296 RepID=A0A8J2MBR1_9BILA|nr:unnamed protein product [Cercopithifilaria johnstoni]